MDVVKAPARSNNKWTYFTYVKPIDDKGNGETTLARANISSEGVLDWQDLIVTHSLFGGVMFDVFGVAWGSDRHFGSRIAFDDNYLYFSIGDRVMGLAHPENPSRFRFGIAHYSLFILMYWLLSWFFCLLFLVAYSFFGCVVYN